MKQRRSEADAVPMLGTSAQPDAAQQFTKAYQASNFIVARDRERA